MKKRILCAFALVIILMISVVGCSDVSSEETTEASVTRPEKTDYPVTVGSLTFNESPKQIACLSPAITEIICELGYSDRITGISSYCNYPEQISGMPDIGSSANPDVKKIIESKPSMLISQSPIAKKDINAIEAAGIRVLILPSPATVDELYNLYYDMSLIFSGELSAENNAKEAFEKLSEVLDKAEGTFESFAYITTADGAVATGDTFAGNFFSCFGENVAKDGIQFEFSYDELKEKEPQYILIDKSFNVDSLPEEYKQLDAVKNNRIIYVDGKLLERPTTRLVSVAEQVISLDSGKSDEKAEQLSETSADTAE